MWLQVFSAFPAIVLLYSQSNYGSGDQEILLRVIVVAVLLLDVIVGLLCFQF